MKWFLKCIKNYVNFTGRARRKEFWFFNLFSFLFLLVAAALDRTLLSPENAFLQSLVYLFLFLPSIAVSVRRLHDTGHCGKILMGYYVACFVWFLLMYMCGGLSVMIALVNGATFADTPANFQVAVVLGGGIVAIWAIFLLVFYCTDGTKGENKYGPDPKAEKPDDKTITD